MDDLLKLINADDLNDLRAVSQDIEASARAEQVEAKLGPREGYYRKLAECLSELHIDVDFDVANQRLLITHMALGKFDVIPMECIDAYIETGKASAAAVAYAIMAGILSPYFHFWEYEEDDD